MNLPDFICIGVQRAGTTWLYECLKEHPDVFVPETKELHFFNDNFEKGIEFYSNFFEEADPTSQVIGELTPNYYHDEKALKRIHEVLPNVKIILVLREPVSRAYSHYQLSSTNQCKGMTFDQALQETPIIKTLSLQSTFVKQVLSLFPSENIHIQIYDDLRERPQHFISEIFNFLKVNASFTPSSIDKRVNRIIFPKLQENLSKFGLSKAVELVKKTPLGDLIKEKYNRTERDKLDNNLDKYRKLFAADVDELEEILKINLQMWKS
jgi:hypothetical protein